MAEEEKQEEKQKIQVVFGPEDQDLLRELDAEVYRRKQSGDRSANRSQVIMERLKAVAALPAHARKRPTR